MIWTFTRVRTGPIWTSTISRQPLKLQLDRCREAPNFSGAVTGPRSICESGSALLSYVCELVRYAREPQSRDAWRRRVPRARDDARPDDDDARQRGDERQRCDDALERDALVIGPSGVP